MGLPQTSKPGLVLTSAAAALRAATRLTRQSDSFSTTPQPSMFAAGVPANSHPGLHTLAAVADGQSWLSLYLDRSEPRAPTRW